MSGGIEGEGRHVEPTPPQPKPANHHPPAPPTTQERAKPPPEKSALNRAVEQTRELYERNGWTFVPLLEEPLDPIVSILREAREREGGKPGDLIPLILEGLKRFDDSNPKYAELIHKKLARLGYPTGEHVDVEELQRMFDLPTDESTNDDQR